MHAELEAGCQGWVHERSERHLLPLGASIVGSSEVREALYLRIAGLRPRLMYCAAAARSSREGDFGRIARRQFNVATINPNGRVVLAGLES